MCKYLLTVLRMFIHSLILILIISLAIHYSQKVFRGFSILVCIGVQVFFRGFFFFSPPLARDSLSHSPRACLRSTEKRWKIAFVLQIQASSMKLRVHCLLFLVFLYIKTDGKNKPFFLQAHQHSDKEVFLGVSREWKLWKILPDNKPNWNEHSSTGLFPGNVSYWLLS